MTLREGIKRIWSWSIHVVISCTWKITRGHKYSIDSMNFTRPHYCTKSWFWSGETERLFFFHLSAMQSLGCTFPPPLLSSLYLWNIHSHALYKQMWKCESSHLSISASQHHSTTALTVVYLLTEVWLLSLWLWALSVGTGGFDALSRYFGTCWKIRNIYRVQEQLHGKINLWCGNL